MTDKIFARQRRGFMDACLLSWKKRGKWQTEIAYMGLRVMLFLALLGNITARQFRVNSAKILNGFV